MFNGIKRSIKKRSSKKRCLNPLTKGKFTWKLLITLTRAVYVEWQAEARGEQIVNGKWVSGRDNQSTNIAFQEFGHGGGGGKRSWWLEDSQERIFKFRLQKFKGVFCLASLEKKKILEKRIMKKQKREGRIEEVTEEEGLRTQKCELGRSAYLQTE